jgi:small subunit ribosomal protein S4
MRLTGPKNRIARREGIDLGMKTIGSKSHANLLKKINVIPGQHGLSRRPKMTDYGIQLREKQKMKRIYGLNESQMKNCFEKASKMTGNSAENLVQLLERRLDNVIYKLAFAPTRSSARQLVSHGHIAVDGKKLSIASFVTSVGELISFNKEKSQKIPYIATSLDKKDAILPKWLERKSFVGKIVALPQREDASEEVNLQLVVEFYSR